MNLFTYGSLMFPEVWLRVAGQSFEQCHGVLKGFAAFEVSGETYPGLAPHPGGQASGVVYLDITAEAMARLDTFEGPFYERIKVPVTTDTGKTIHASTYAVVAEHRHELTQCLWDAETFRRHHLTHFLGPRPTEK